MKTPGDHLENKTCDTGPFFEVLTAEELASRWRVPESWVREQTRSRCLDPIPTFGWDATSDSVGTVQNSRPGGNGAVEQYTCGLIIALC